MELPFNEGFSNVLVGTLCNVAMPLCKAANDLQLCMHPALSAVIVTSPLLAG
jgi:hypothetical protein